MTTTSVLLLLQPAEAESVLQLQLQLQQYLQSGLQYPNQITEAFEEDFLPCRHGMFLRLLLSFMRRHNLPFTIARSRCGTTIALPLHLT